MCRSCCWVYTSASAMASPTLAAAKMNTSFSMQLLLVTFMETSGGKRSRDASDSSPSSPSPSQFTAAQAAQFLAFSSSESDDMCGPHQDCCGGNVVNGAYAPCVKRLGKPGSQHARKQVCLSLHKHYKCISCPNVAHAGCWVPTANGSHLLASPFNPLTCYDCDVIRQVSLHAYTLICVHNSNNGDTEASLIILTSKSSSRD